MHLYRNSNTIEDKLNALLYAKYPEADSLKYYTELSLCKQNNNTTITLYKDAIDEICPKIGICKHWTVETRSFKQDEVFYTGLTKRTQLEMARLNVKTLTEMKISYKQPKTLWLSN